MRKNKKRRKNRFIIIIALLVILLGVYIFADSKDEGEISNEDTNIANEKPEEGEEEENNSGEDKDEEIPDDNSEDEPELERPIESPDYSLTIEDPGAIDVLVNRRRSLPMDYIPEDLVTLDDLPTVLINPEVNQMRKEAYQALKEMFAAAKEEEGYELHARSGYRSYNTQASLYSSYVENYGQSDADKYSAKPGQSEHQTGLAMDITCEAINYQLEDTFVDTDEGSWVAQNAHRFGYIIRYPKGKEDITGYNYEPWHIRYLGPELAKEVYESGLTLEEFME